MKIGTIVYSEEFGYGKVTRRYNCKDLPLRVEFLIPATSWTTYTETGKFWFNFDSYDSRSEYRKDVKPLKFQILAKIWFWLRKVCN